MEGNHQKMREALYNIQEYAAAMDVDDGNVLAILDACRDALSAPARQCDVGTPEEQGERFLAQFNEWRRKGDGKKLITAIMEWEQMPYEAQEGGMGDGV